MSSRTPNYKNFAIRNHIETLNSSLVNSYAGAIDLLTIDSRILILIDNGTIVQLNSNLTEVKKFTLNQTLMENRYPY